MAIFGKRTPPPGGTTGTTSADTTGNQTDDKKKKDDAEDEQDGGDDEDTGKQAYAKGVAAGAKAERERIGAIFGSAEAEGRDDLAMHFAFETEMPAKAAVAALAKAPKAAAPETTADTGAKGNPLALQKMNASKQPDIGAGNGDGGAMDADARLGASYAALVNSRKG